ncbi:hypothetical protein HDK77DRAFT_303742 [Phyllosticta capitalensis]|uniref:Transcriptional regulator n=1 Tax=Phyllosticta capitalensis TaxID=121624 RepID=A0ABR1YEY2_9PEZI
MSDSDFDAPPSPKLEKGLRNEVRVIWDTGNHDGLTVKRVRKATEERMNLPEDFFKNHGSWKGRSDRIIKGYVNELGNQNPPTNEDAISADEIEESPKPRRGRKKNTEQPAKAPRKRAPAQPKSASRKKRKVSVESDESADEAVHSVEETVTGAAKLDQHSDADSDVEQPKPEEPESKHAEVKDDGSDDDEADGPVVSARKSSEPSDKTADSESELSSLLDEAPPPKAKRQKKSASVEKKPAKTKVTKVKQEKEVDPQDAEIKRLQGWLVKCGIRKVWGKELKPFTTPREKISHLKGMLKDAGMDGRYSVEKARQIKERRELAADLEAVQEGNKKWGQSDSEGEDAKGRPRRRLARGLKDLEGLIDEDGEESD